MEKTLHLPDELADRLAQREDQLGRILELGLRVVEREEGELGSEPDEELPAVWEDALADLMSQQRRASEEPPPSPEEVIAYYRDELDPGEREKWLERLALHPDAVRDLVDLIEFGRAGEPTARELQETQEALRSFRTRVGGGVSPPRRVPWLAWAAVLALAVGASWIPWLWDRQTPPSSPRYAAVIDVAASRGARPFPVSEEAQEILLILPLEVAAGSERGTLQITTADGDVVYRGTFHITGDRWSRLCLSLPRDRLQPGTYRIEITIAATDARPGIREYRFAIEDPAAR
jgi:hypothetical protein